MRESHRICIAAVAAMGAGAGAAAGSALQININGRMGVGSQQANAAATGAATQEAQSQLIAFGAMNLDGAHDLFVAANTLHGFPDALAIACGTAAGQPLDRGAGGAGATGASIGALFSGAELAGPGFSIGGPTSGGNLHWDGGFDGLDLGAWSDGAEAMSLLPAAKPAPGRGGADIERIVGVTGVLSAPLPAGIGLGAAGLIAIAGYSTLARWRR